SAAAPNADGSNTGRKQIPGNDALGDGVTSAPVDMAPKPYEDLFIEPAGDYDVVYGDYNTTFVYSCIFQN
ncbi:unnamed protein product, partial [Gongylonema pulchrum]|uniref:OCRE domain-containing protein n=1 Tax=Gongylonema pulchrum TaxID=637853 RepID=A0A183EDV2_9BILA